MDADVVWLKKFACVFSTYVLYEQKDSKIISTINTANFLLLIQFFNVYIHFTTSTKLNPQIILYLTRFTNNPKGIIKKKKEKKISSFVEFIYVYLN